MTLEEHVGRRGLVATSHPLAVEAGLEALEAGGTAADAAVAAAATLCVVDPRSTGVGGDAFALSWPAHEPAPGGLAAAGPAPAGMTLEAVRAADHRTTPRSGPWTVTVPGAVAGWHALLLRHGRLGLDRALARAIDHAERGFQVTPFVAEEWSGKAGKLRRDEAASGVYLPGGRSPAAGERFMNPMLAAVLRRIADEGPDAFYRGELAERIGDAVAAGGGPLRAGDLEAWDGPSWEEPLQRGYAGHVVYEPPPPGQGVVVLEALGIAERVDAADLVDRVHVSIEAIKLAFADAVALVADPLVRPVPVERLLSDDYLDARAGEIDLGCASEATAGRATDTAYVAVVDEDGSACSFIQSLYDGFGSGVGVPGSGIVLHNRGAGFVLEDDHPNRPEPGKRPYHTIVPAMLGRDGRVAGVLGVVGGFQQPQGQLQILRSMVEDGFGPQAAVDRPRFRSMGGQRVGFEPAFDRDVVRALADRGHEVSELSRFEAGGAQLIWRRDDGFVGASDPRKDGRVGVR